MAGGRLRNRLWRERESRGRDHDARPRRILAERRDDLLGLVITHAHEDHIGAVAHLWRQLRCPIYATPFATAVLRRKLGEAGLLNEVRIHTIPSGGTFELAPFSLQFLPVSHSIPEAQALVLRTPYGIILHTGDFKLDPNPLVGANPTDEAAFARLGEGGRAGDGLRQHQCDGRRDVGVGIWRCGKACMI